MIVMKMKQIVVKNSQSHRIIGGEIVGINYT